MQSNNSTGEAHDDPANLVDDLTSQYLGVEEAKVDA
jgi:hypothetical protein